MGNRAQVRIVAQHENEHDVYLYTHWGGSNLDQSVARAIARGERWGDSEYLARIVFEEMIDAHSERGSATGLGIGSAQHGDVHTVVDVDVAEREVRINAVERVGDARNFETENVVVETHSFEDLAATVEAPA